LKGFGLLFGCVADMAIPAALVALIGIHICKPNSSHDCFPLK